MKRSLILLLLLLTWAGDAVAFDPLQGARRAAAAGQRAFAEGDTTAAIRHLMRAQALAPEDAQINMGLAETLYRSMEYEAARRQYEVIGLDPAGEYATDALYNAGNAAFDTGDLEGALELYTRAVLDAEGSPSPDLLHNLELAQRLLEEQQQQQEQSGQDPSEDRNQEQGDRQQDQEQQQQDQPPEQQPEQDQQQEQPEQPQDEQEQATPPQEKPSEEQSDPQEQPAAEENQEMTPEEAMRLLQALDADEEELRKSIQRRLRGDEKEAERDW